MIGIEVRIIFLSPPVSRLIDCHVHIRPKRFNKINLASKNINLVYPELALLFYNSLSNNGDRSRYCPAYIVSADSPVAGL